jgi:hypothetical protein
VQQNGEAEFRGSLASPPVLVDLSTLKFFVAPRLYVFCWGLLFVVREARRAICDGRGSQNVLSQSFPRLKCESRWEPFNLGYQYLYST